jgi:hypothetical protein
MWMFSWNKKQLFREGLSLDYFKDYYVEDGVLGFLNF